MLVEPTVFLFDGRAFFRTRVRKIVQHVCKTEYAIESVGRLGVRADDKAEKGARRVRHAETGGHDGT